MSRGRASCAPKTKLRIGRRAIPDEHIELVIDEAGQGALVLVADELAKLRRGGGGFGDLLLGLLGRIDTLRRKGLLLREHVARLGLVEDVLPSRLDLEYPLAQREVAVRGHSGSSRH